MSIGLVSLDLIQLILRRLMDKMKIFGLIFFCVVCLFSQMFWKDFGDGYGIIFYYTGQLSLRTYALYFCLTFISRNKDYVAYLLMFLFTLLSGFDLVKAIFFSPFNVSICQYWGIILSVIIIVLSELYFYGGRNNAANSNGRKFE